MNTFQGVVLGGVFGFCIFLPVSVTAQLFVISYFIGWQTLPDILFGIFNLISFICLLVYYRHDFASIISSILQVVFLQKKLGGFDDRILGLTLLTIIPYLLVINFLGHDLSFLKNPLYIGTFLIITCFLFMFAQRVNRKIKNMTHFSLYDSFIMGLFQVLSIIPGVGRQMSILSCTYLRNYNVETSAKLTFFSIIPFLLLNAFLSLKNIDFNNVYETYEITWLTIIVSSLTCFFAGMLSINGFLNNLNNLKGFIVYRFILGFSIFIFYFVTSF